MIEPSYWTRYSLVRLHIEVPPLSPIVVSTNNMAANGVSSNGHEDGQPEHNGTMKAVHSVRLIAGPACAELMYPQLQDPSLFVESAYIDGTWVEKEERFDVYGKYESRNNATISSLTVVQSLHPPRYWDE